VVENIIEIDKALFLFLNGIHNAFFDSVMWQISGKAIWIPLYIVILYGLFKRTGKQFIWVFIAVVIAVAAADLISVHAFKNVFERFRPTHTPEFQQLVHTVNNYKGGLYGFVSSHAANSFALAVISGLFFQKKQITYALIVWACLVSYSRIYLGVHFPADIVCGALLGSMIAYLVYILFQQVFKIKASVFPK